MIRVRLGVLADEETEALLRPIRADLAPVTLGAREVDLRAGPALVERLESLGALPVGGAVVTPAGDLGVTFVIHAVVSSVEEPQTASTVRRALENGLRRAADLGMESLSVPPLGMGAGNLQVEDAAEMMVEALFAHLDEGLPPRDITVVVASEYEEAVFTRAVERAGARHPGSAS